MKNNPNVPRVKSHLVYCRRIISTPATGDVFPVNGSHDDYKSLKPHPDIHNHRHEKSDRQISSEFTEPEYLRGQNVASHHNIVGPSIRRKQIHPVCMKAKFSYGFCPYPRDKQFREISNPHNRTREYNNFIHHIDMLDCNYSSSLSTLRVMISSDCTIANPENTAPGNKIRREDGCMPAGNN